MKQVQPEPAQPEMEHIADAGEHIGGLLFVPLSLKRHLQMLAAIREVLPNEQDAALFQWNYDTFASLYAAASGGASLDPSVFMAHFHSVLREHAESLLKILSEFSGHAVEALEGLTPNQIRRAFEVLLEIPTSVGCAGTGNRA